MSIIDRIKGWFGRRKKTKQDQETIIQARKDFLSNLDKDIKTAKQEVKTLQDEKAALDEGKNSGIESSQYSVKKGRIGKQRIEIEVLDGERSSFYPAKIIDGYWIQWKDDNEVHKKIIGTRPRTFEYKTFIFWRRGLKYYIKRDAEITHEPDASAFVLPQAKFAMRIVAAVIKAETFVEIAKATRGKDRKELIIWLVAFVILGLGGIAGSGGYFK